jgi:hypothetical protein
MVVSPADEDYARALIHVLCRRVVALGAVPVDEAAEAFRSLGFGDSRDFEAALACAQAKGWASVELDRVRLRQRGIDETMSAGFRITPYAPSGPGGPLPRFFAALRARLSRAGSRPS